MYLKHVVRRLVQFPAFTSIAALSLALGIGANKRNLRRRVRRPLKPLPDPASDWLVAVDHAAPGVNLQAPDPLREAARPDVQARLVVLLGGEAGLDRVGAASHQRLE